MPTRPLRKLTAACAAAAVLGGTSALPARAEVLTWSDEARLQIEGDLESPQLRTLRLLEQEWFGAGPAERPEDYDPDCALGTPDSLSSAAPPASVEREGEVVDLGFLSELDLPGLPVRWDSRVIDYLLFFKNDPNGRALLASWLRRQEIYGPMIRRVLAEAGLPQDLQYVAMVESGFDPRARSYAAAQGLWQFMGRAGTHYGLRIDRWVDERLDPEKATHAAARFLGELYRRFGSWELAFAAYNMGYGGLLRSVRKFNTNDYWVLSHMESGLPYETALYVSKITAVAIIAHNKDRFGFGALEMIEPERTRSVEVAAGTYLKQIAVGAGVETDVIVELNPELRRKRVPPEGDTWKVRIPAESFDRFAHRFRHRDPIVARTHTLRFGESFEDVARTYQITPQKLRALNDLEPSEPVFAGETLFVPPNKAQERRSEEEPPVIAVPAEFDEPGLERVFYRVASHDSVDEVAAFFGVDEADLRRWNHLAEGADLQSGMFLQLYVDPDFDLATALVLTPDEATVLVAGSEAFFDFHEKQRGRARIRYVCQEGDTLASIGERFELSAGSIARINQFSTRHELNAGEIIVVYVPEDQVSALTRKGLIAPLRGRGGDAPARAPQKPEPNAKRNAEGAAGAVTAAAKRLPTHEALPARSREPRAQQAKTSEPNKAAPASKTAETSSNEQTLPATAPKARELSALPRPSIDLSDAEDIIARAIRAASEGTSP